MAKNVYTMLFYLILFKFTTYYLGFQIMSRRQDSSLVAVVDPELRGTGLESRCGRNLSLVHKYAVTYSGQIRGIIMPTERINDSLRHQKTYKKMKND